MTFSPSRINVQPVAFSKRQKLLQKIFLLTFSPRTILYLGQNIATRKCRINFVAEICQTRKEMLPNFVFRYF